MTPIPAHARFAFVSLLMALSLSACMTCRPPMTARCRPTTTSSSSSRRTRTTSRSSIRRRRPTSPGWRRSTATLPGSTARCIPARPTMWRCWAGAPSASMTTTPGTAAPARRGNTARAPRRRAGANPARCKVAQHRRIELTAKGLTWKGYFEDLPEPGSLVVIASKPEISDGTRSTALYASKHPASSIADVQADPQSEPAGGLRSVRQGPCLGGHAQLRPDRAQPVQRDARPVRPQGACGLLPQGGADHPGRQGGGRAGGAHPAEPGLVRRRQRRHRHHLRRGVGRQPGRLLRDCARVGGQLRRRPYPDGGGDQPRPARRGRRHALRPLFPAADHGGRLRDFPPPGPRGGDQQGRGPDGQAVRGGEVGTLPSPVMGEGGARLRSKWEDGGGAPACSADLRPPPRLPGSSPRRLRRGDGSFPDKRGRFEA